MADGQEEELTHESASRELVGWKQEVKLVVPL